MNCAFRPFTPDDYPAVAAIYNEAFPDHRQTEDDWRRNDANRRPDLFHERWVAEDGVLLGYASVNHMEGMFHPDRYFTRIVVHPEHRRKGIGGALYERVMDTLCSRSALAMRSFCREDMAESIAFMDKRGFREDTRDWESRLDVAAFDFAPFQDAWNVPEALGLAVHTFAELESDPDRDRKFYELDIAGTMDEPSPEPHTLPSFERFMERKAADVHRLPDAVFIAVAGDEYVGLSELERSDADDDLHTGFTCVRREWRGKGLALALKLRAIDYARKHGAATIRTDNASINAPMLAVNNKLGFQRQPAWIDFVKTLREDAL